MYSIKTIGASSAADICTYFCSTLSTITNYRNDERDGVRAGLQAYAEYQVYEEEIRSFKNDAEKSDAFF